MKTPLGRHDVAPEQLHYQREMGALVRIVKPKIVVETGLDVGIGAEYILQAMDAVGEGHLYSIDPFDPKNIVNGRGWSADFMLANPITHPRFTWIRKYSNQALEPLFKAVGPFDLFIHDSDHGVECQTYEYEAAWLMVRSGGIIASDDVTWGQPPHDAWPDFLKRHGFDGDKTVGAAHYIVKP